MRGLVTPGPKTPAPQPHSHTTPGAGVGPPPLPLTHEPPEPAPTAGRNRPRDGPSVVLAGGHGCYCRTAAPDPRHRGATRVAHQPGGRASPGSTTPHTVYLPSVLLALREERITTEPKAVTRSKTPAQCRPACFLAPHPLQMVLARSRDWPSAALTPCQGPAQGGAGLKCSPCPAPRGPPSFIQAAGRLSARLKRRETCTLRGFRVNGAGGDCG